MRKKCSIGYVLEVYWPVNALDFDASLGIDFVNAFTDEGRDLGSCLVQVLSKVNPEGGQPFGQPLVTTLEGEGLDTLFVRRQTTVLALETLQNPEKLDGQARFDQFENHVEYATSQDASINGNMIDRNTNK